MSVATVTKTSLLTVEPVRSYEDTSMGKMDDYNVPCNASTDMCEETYDVSFWQVPQLVILVLLFIFIVFGNSCVLVAIGLSESGRKTRMNFFIMNLAIADLTVGLFHITVDIVERCTVTWLAGGPLCKIVRFLQALVVYASTFMLVSLSIDRVDAIARPMNFTRKAVTVRALIYATWGGSALFSLPSVLFFNVKELNGNVFCVMTLQENWQWQLYISLVALTAFVIPALIITVCYTVIICVIWDKGRGISHAFQTRSFRAPVASQLNEGRELGGHGIIPQAKIRTFKLTLIIVVVFIICWCPYFVFNLIDVYMPPIHKSNTELAITSLIQSLAPLNSAANPIIYGIFSTRVCRNLRRIPLVNCIADFICRCNLHKHHSPRTGYQSTTDQTLIDGTTISKPGFRRNGNRAQMLEPENSTMLHPVFSNCKSGRNPTANAQDKKKSKLHNRRPSGLPLVNRGISEEDTLILKTYTVKFTPPRIEYINNPVLDEDKKNCKANTENTETDKMDNGSEDTQSKDD